MGRSLTQKFRILQAALLAQAGGSLARHPAVRFALRAFQEGRDSPTVADVTTQIGLSSRRFIEVFRAQVGLTPKRYWRIRRFQDAIRLLETGAECASADLALACGDFDQAYFIHGFGAFSGLSPLAYLRQRGPQLNHVPLPD